MGLAKYLFNAGEQFPAENANSIDPENLLGELDAFKLVRVNADGKLVSNNNIKYEALEDILRGENVFIDDNWTNFLKTAENTNVGASYNLNSSSLKVGQTFTPKYSSDQTIIELRYRVYGNGDFTNASLYATDENGLPTGGAIQTVNKVGSSYNTGGIQNRTYTFTFTVTLTAGVLYAVIFNTSGASTNYSIMDYGANNIPDGTLLYNNGSGWAVISGNDLNMSVYEKEVFAEGPYLLKSDGGDLERAKFAGKASDDVLTGEVLKVETDLFKDPLYSRGDLFFLGADGADSETPLAVPIKVGYALESGWLNLSQNKVVKHIYQNSSAAKLLFSQYVSSNWTNIFGYHKVQFDGTHYFRFSGPENTNITIYKNAVSLGSMNSSTPNLSLTLTRGDILVVTGYASSSATLSLYLDNGLIDHII